MLLLADLDELGQKYGYNKKKKIQISPSRFSLSQHHTIWGDQQWDSGDEFPQKEGEIKEQIGTWKEMELDIRLWYVISLMLK